jgi:hypothetical protein
MPHARSSGRGKLQPNRSDLTRPTAEQVPNQGYGIAAQQKVAQQAIPMGLPPTSGPNQAASGPQSGPTPQQPGAGQPMQGAPVGPPQGPMSALAGAPLVGANGPLTRPTERPGEPVTHGLPMGPGGGPESLTGIGAAARQGAVEQGTLTHLLTSLAAQPGATSAIKDLAVRAQNGAA